jgi:DNA-binding PadR family transcriptional regulator
VPAPNRTCFAVLGFLTLGPMSGYDIKKLVEESVDNFWSESWQIYPALRKLSEDGLIAKQATASEGGRPRHVYSIQDRGREALAAWLREPTEPAPVRIELLLKLFFGARCDRATNREQILAYREQMVRDLERYQSINELLHRERADAADLPYWLLTLRFGERDRAAHIAWCDEALAVLEGLPDAGSEAGDEGNPTWRKSTRTGT